MLAYMFPGQGAQFKGMGNGLFELFPELTQEADHILGYSIQSLCLDDLQSKLNQTQYTQPALFIVNALSYLKKSNEKGAAPDYVLGHSLGEYNALFAAGVFDFKTGVSLTHKRGELMSQAKNGSMAAVIGLKQDEIQHLLIEHGLADIKIANYNSYKQLVISGPGESINKAKQLFCEHRSIHFVVLKVSGAFHSIYMENAQKLFADFLEPFEFATPSIPIIANYDAGLYHPRVTKTNLIKQLTAPVLWTSMIEHLNAQGPIVFEEVGPGNILSGLLRRIKDQQ